MKSIWLVLPWICWVGTAEAAEVGDLGSETASHDSTIQHGEQAVTVLETTSDEEKTVRSDSPPPSTKAKVVYADPNDPFERFNRVMWDFNYKVVDRYLFRPIAHGYKDYVPSPVKTGLDNFVRNLEEPASLVNNTLQGKFVWAVNAGGRFVINTSIGLVGIVDVAEMMGMPRKQDDFNEVVGYYGVPNGPYFMLPFAGPYVTRELATDWVDGLYFPLSELTFWQSALKWGLKGVNARAAAIDKERLLDNSLDPYTFAKDAYLQHIDYKLYDGNVPTNQNDELLDEYMQELE